MAEELTTIEQKNLNELEATITKNLSAFYEVGFALMQIRDNKLYRETHGTFEEYCKGKWNFNSSRARQLISAAEVTDNIKSVTNVTVLKEGQIRPLVGIKDPDQQREVIQKAVETAPSGKVTGKHIENTIKQVTEYKHTETHPVSDALFFAGIAIVQLEGIRKDDPMRIEALHKVIDWCQKQIKEEIVTTTLKDDPPFLFPDHVHLFEHKRWWKRLSVKDHKFVRKGIREYAEKCIEKYKDRALS